jgi:hypothetical protein
VAISAVHPDGHCILRKYLEDIKRHLMETRMPSLLSVALALSFSGLFVA